MCEAPSTWRARTWSIPPTFFSAAYRGLMAAPGMPNAVSTPSRRITSTAASIALILAIVLCLVCYQIVYKTAGLDSIHGLTFWSTRFVTKRLSGKKSFKTTVLAGVLDLMRKSILITVYKDYLYCIRLLSFLFQVG